MAESEVLESKVWRFEVWDSEVWSSEVWDSEELCLEGVLENEITKRMFKRTLKSVRVVETMKGVR